MLFFARRIEEEEETVRVGNDKNKFRQKLNFFEVNEKISVNCYLFLCTESLFFNLVTKVLA